MLRACLPARFFTPQREKLKELIQVRYPLSPDAGTRPSCASKGVARPCRIYRSNPISRCQFTSSARLLLTSAIQAARKKTSMVEWGVRAWKRRFPYRGRETHIFFCWGKFTLLMLLSLCFSFFSFCQGYDFVLDCFDGGPPPLN